MNWINVIAIYYCTFQLIKLILCAVRKADVSSKRPEVCQRGVSHEEAGSQPAAELRAVGGQPEQEEEAQAEAIAHEPGMESEAGKEKEG